MKTVLAFFTILIVTACSLAPTYHRPELHIPDTYKEIDDWLPANPNAAVLDKGPWWELYDDPELNQLEKQVILANQDLKAALARYEQAIALAKVARSNLFPTINAIAIPSRQRTSENTANPVPVNVYNDVLLGLDLSYELDIWGAVRNSVRAANDEAKASAADLAALNLSLQAELASNYFSLRGAEHAQNLLDKTVEIYKKALYLNQQLYEGGAAPVDIVYQSQTQLENAETLATDMRLRRAQLEHAIAVLIGKVPADFNLPETPDKTQNLVTISPDLPSTLLERRPDIAAAELRVQAANANIGVARAAYFPSFNLTGSFGVESEILGNLLEQPSLVWSLGPPLGAAALGTFNDGAPIFYNVYDAGRISAQTDEAWGIYNETVANYRQTVLLAYREVEDSLVALRRLNEENTTQTQASTAAMKAVEQANYRYRGGLTTYLDVVVQQNIALQTELAAVNIRTQYQLASVSLIKALGGGWKKNVDS